MRSATARVESVKEERPESIQRSASERSRLRASNPNAAANQETMSSTAMWMSMMRIRRLPSEEREIFMSTDGG